MKFFVISDTHSFYDEMITALNEAGFDPNNENHWLIGCGDYFDRGEQSQQIFDYLMSLPRKTLIKGNHDDMMVDLLQRGYPHKHDTHNGATGTFYQLAGDITADKPAMVNYVAAKFHALYDQMVDYFETENYIFVHSWIPLVYEGWGKTAYVDNWREASEDEWQEARWDNPFKLARLGLKPDKTIVFGHWHTSWPRAFYEDKKEWGETADFSIYYGDGYIGIDACTAYTHKVNVLVLDDNFLS